MAKASLLFEFVVKADFVGMQQAHGKCVGVFCQGDDGVLASLASIHMGGDFVRARLANMAA